jgi:chromosome partitioning protein
MRVIAIYNIKGGVGKTAAAVNLAYLSAAAGARTLLWDLDPQAAATFYFRIKPKLRGGVRKLMRRKRTIDSFIRGTDFENLDLLPADFSNRNLDLVLDESNKPARRLARLIGPLAEDYDELLIDCAPSISLVSESVFEAADILLVPTIPTTLSLRTLEQLKKHLVKQGPKELRLLPFFSMVDRRKAMHRKVADRACGTPSEFLNSRIPYSSQVEQMGTRRTPLPVYAPGSAPARAFLDLWHEISAKPGKRS